MQVKGIGFAIVVSFMWAGFALGEDRRFLPSEISDLHYHCFKSTFCDLKFKSGDDWYVKRYEGSSAVIASAVANDIKNTTRGIHIAYDRDGEHRNKIMTMWIYLK